jgi:ribosomal protein S18 acetylase RimI-like enzyme
MTITLRHGLPEHLRDDAARLYWQAFGGKLGRVMGPDRMALRFIHRVMRADHCIVALAPDGALLGLAGFKTPDSSFAGGTSDDLRVIYGRAGALWRSALLQLLANDVDNDRFLLDGLCVVDGAQGRGVGTALLEAICIEARSRGYGAVRLEVVDTNARARALYERTGFVTARTAPIGLLRLIFGFNAAHTMVRQL